VTSKNNIGTVVGNKYEIGHVIGSGGMGVVYAATDLGTRQRVAIKLLHRKYADSQKFVKRFYQEAALADSLDHPNICRVVDHGCTKDDAPYLVMPLLEGCPFSRLLRRNKHLPIERVVRIAAQTLSALQAAHNKRIVHRDLKPDNIFVLSAEAPPDTVKLLDFGISKVIEKGASSSLTSTGMVLGTAYYLAPEQARGDREIDHRVDIYAMGVILYQALAGRLPFVGETYNEVVFKIAGDAYKPPRVVNRSISRAVEQVIIKAMAFDPLMRFETAHDMNEALAEALERPEPEGAYPAADLFASTEKMSAAGGRHDTPRARRRIGLFLSVISVVFASVLGIVWWRNGESTTGASPTSVKAGDVTVKSPVDENLLSSMPLDQEETLFQTEPKAAVEAETDGAPSNKSGITKGDGSASPAVATTAPPLSEPGAKTVLRSRSGIRKGSKSKPQSGFAVQDKDAENTDDREIDNPGVSKASGCTPMGNGYCRPNSAISRPGATASSN
jgi:serine/threonine protein kinase